MSANGGTLGPRRALAPAPLHLLAHLRVHVLRLHVADPLLPAHDRLPLRSRRRVSRLARVCQVSGRIGTGRSGTMSRLWMAAWTQAWRTRAIWVRCCAAGGLNLA